MVVHYLTCIYRIADNLTQLQGLDLSDCPVLDNLTFPLLQSRSSTSVLSTNATTSGDFATIDNLLLNLRWLGLPDWRRPETIPRSLLVNILPRCKNLKTLSIRGKYMPEVKPAHIDHHDYVCRFIGGIVTHTPDSVEYLELRLSFPFLDRLVEELQKRQSRIKQIGIDLGAWIQVYPLRVTQGFWNENEVKNAAIAAAQKTRFDIYEEEHNKVLPDDSKWWLPELPRPYAAEEKDCNDPECQDTSPTWSEARNAYERDYYSVIGGSCQSQVDSGRTASKEAECLFHEPGHTADLLNYLTDKKVNTLPGMLYKLYEMSGRLSGYDGTNIFPL